MSSQKPERTFQINLARRQSFYQADFLQAPCVSTCLHAEVDRYFELLWHENFFACRTWRPWKRTTKKWASKQPKDARLSQETAVYFSSCFCFSDFTCQNINRKGVLQRFYFVHQLNQEKAKRRDTWNEPEAASHFLRLCQIVPLIQKCNRPLVSLSSANRFCLPKDMAMSSKSHHVRCVSYLCCTKFGHERVVHLLGKQPSSGFLRPPSWELRKEILMRIRCVHWRR